MVRPTPVVIIERLKQVGADVANPNKCMTFASLNDQGTPLNIDPAKDAMFNWTQSGR